MEKNYAIHGRPCVLEMGRYRYLESVFGIFVGIFSCRFGIQYRYLEIPWYRYF